MGEVAEPQSGSTMVVTRGKKVFLDELKPLDFGALPPS